MYYIVFILVPTACVPLVRRLPETNGLSLEEIAAKFGDEVAVDIQHLSDERRNAVNIRLLQSDSVSLWKERELLKLRKKW
jgi:hypothetical protein